MSASILFQTQGIDPLLRFHPQEIHAGRTIDVDGQLLLALGLPALHEPASASKSSNSRSWLGWSQANWNLPLEGFGETVSEAKTSDSDNPMGVTLKQAEVS